jgi:hypothetical protein
MIYFVVAGRQNAYCCHLPVRQSAAKCTFKFMRSARLLTDRDRTFCSQLVIGHPRPRYRSHGINSDSRDAVAVPFHEIIFADLVAKLTTYPLTKSIW